MEVQARQGSPRHHQEEVRVRRLHDAGVPAVRVAVRRRQPPGHILHLRAAGPQNCRWVNIFPSLLSHLNSCLHLLFSGLVQASLLPLLLTMILFLGPTAMLLLDVGYTPCIVHILLILVSILSILSSYNNNSIFS